MENKGRKVTRNVNWATGKCSLKSEWSELKSVKKFFLFQLPKIIL